MTMDKSLFFFTLSVILLYIVLSQFYGKQYITQFVIALLPNSQKG